MIDAHCHLNSERLDAEPGALIAEAVRGGVEAIVMAGVDSLCWASQLHIAARWPGRALPVFGLHPQAVTELDAGAIAAELRALSALLETHRPVALGELGLDGLTEERRARMVAQTGAFEAQLELAARHDLPVVLHLLKCEAESLAILRKASLPRGGVVHGFSGAAPFARALVDLGLHISFSGTLTLPQSRRLREAARAVPPERLLIETDSPDQTPYAARVQGERRPNRPAYLGHVAAALAEARGEELGTIAALTAQNARRLFRLP